MTIVLSKRFLTYKLVHYYTYLRKGENAVEIAGEIASVNKRLAQDPVKN